MHFSWTLSRHMLYGCTHAIWPYSYSPTTNVSPFCLSHTRLHHSTFKFMEERMPASSFICKCDSNLNFSLCTSFMRRLKTTIKSDLIRLNFVNLTSNFRLDHTKLHANVTSLWLAAVRRPTSLRTRFALKFDL